MKDSRFVVPVEKKERDKVVAHHKTKGFDSTAAYIRWLIRRDMEGKDGKN